MKDIKPEKIEGILKNEGVGILPTDTLYGLVGQALSQKAVRRVSRLKKRDSGNPFIILISSLKDLNLFGVKIDNKTKKILKKYWPGKVSVILPCDLKKFEYLYLRTKTLAFRIPDKKELLKILKNTGPLVAPSANPKFSKPAVTIKEAKGYFGNKVNFYINEGRLESLPSTLIKIENGKILVLRKGAVRI
jgi:L-threonylcarbamoyladenylate synthase